jgi:hypothetical protein
VTRVRSGGLNRLNATLAIEQAAGRHLKQRANELRQIALDLHRTAPRGGPGINKYGELRSPKAGGTAPAVEEGGLYAMIDQGVTLDRMSARVVVNFGFGPSKGSMEKGTRRMRPRPLGALAVAELESRIK